MRQCAAPGDAKLYFTQAEWDAFILGVKDGEFDSSEDRSRAPALRSGHPERRDRSPGLLGSEAQPWYIAERGISGPGHGRGGDLDQDHLDQELDPGVEQVAGVAVSGALFQP